MVNLVKKLHDERSHLCQWHEWFYLNSHLVWVSIASIQSKSKAACDEIDGLEVLVSQDLPVR
jgi:hypothetical protein